MNGDSIGRISSEEAYGVTVGEASIQIGYIRSRITIIILICTAIVIVGGEGKMQSINGHSTGSECHGMIIGGIERGSVYTRHENDTRL